MSLALQMVFNMQMLPTTYLAIRKGMERRMSFQSKSHELRIIRYEEFSIHAKSQKNAFSKHKLHSKIARFCLQVMISLKSIY